VSENFIEENVRRILDELPPGVQLEAACKTRTPQEVQQAVNAGITFLGENYVQEAEEAHSKISGNVRWHLIGHLQRNKVNRALNIFDMIESLDSYQLARQMNEQCEKMDKDIECLIEINSGREEHKYGIMPEEIGSFIAKVKGYKRIKIMGVMTMGPFMGQEEDFRPYFRITREIFNALKNRDLPNCQMKYLSMGMSESYKVAIEEGANLVRVGTKIFGPRVKHSHA
jgi:pyridoxal phosphate enzyme (YggS family)